MSNYIGVPYINQISPSFPKEDFNGSNFGNVTGAYATHTNAIALSVDVPGANAENLLVVLDNVVQEPDVAYTVHEDSNNQPKILKFSEAPATNASIYVVHRGIGNYNMAPPAGSVTSTQLASGLKNITTDSFTGNGSATAYTLTETPPHANSILVIVDGIVQKVSTNYNVSGATLTFSSAPDASAEIEVKHLGVRGVIRRGPDFQIDNLTGDGSATAFTLTNAGVTANNAFVYYNGVCLKPTTDYGISGTTITFTFAPVNASEIMVRYQL
jgi:hypothetical protein